MKRAMSIMAILLAASLAVGQSTASKPAAAPAKTKTAKNTSAKPATAAAPAKAAPQAAAKNKSATSPAKPAAPKAAVSKPAAKAKPASVKPAAKPAAKAAAPKPAAKPVAKPAVAKAKTAAKPAEAAAARAQGTGAQATSRRRDPFINPITAVREGLSTACQGGKRCLEVTEIILRGIVRAPTGMIAVVENAAQRTYFLRENDPIYNGFVQKITPDTVVFKEHFIDSLGRDNQREIVKTVNAPVV